MFRKLVSEYRFDPSECPENSSFDLIHYGYVCIVDEHSNVLYSAGDCDDMVFYRSASKPIQALPIFKYGLDQKYGITERESVIFSGSHTGLPYHVEAVESILKKSGFSEDILCINPTYPSDMGADEERIRKGLPYRKLYHTCSGKHAALLLIQRYLGGEPEDYWRAGTPVFQEVADVIRTMAETDRMNVGVDGCGVPVFAVPIKNMAISFKNLACIDTISDEQLQHAVKKNTKRITSNPEMIRGLGYICTIMNQEPNIIAKAGANGVYGIGLKKQRLGIALKFVDGTEAAFPFLIMEVLRALGALTPGLEKRLETLDPVYFVNDNDKIVGERRCEVKIALEK